MASITLDFRAGQVAEPLEPDIDDLGRANVITAKRRNGDSVTASLDTGPRGTVAIGRNPKDVDVNPSTDAALALHAAHHLALATEPGPRYPTITVNLNANPTLVAAVAALDVGDRASLARIPPELGWPDADTLILGYQETIGTHSREFAFNTARGGILTHVGKLDGGAAACLQTAGAQLDSAIATEQTNFNVFTTSGPLFTTNPPTGARVIVDDRDVMTVSTISSILTDTATRTISNGWGTPDVGPAWTTSGGAAANYSVNGSRLVISVASLNAERVGVSGVSLLNIDITGVMQSPVTPTGANFEIKIIARYVDSSNFVDARLFLNPGGTVTCAVRQFVAAVETISSFPTVPGVTATSLIAWRLQAAGDQLRFKAWLSGDGEPVDWTVTMTTTHLSAGSARLGNFFSSSVTNALPVAIEYDNVAIINPQTFTVTRDPDRQLPHVAGKSVKAYRGLRLTL